MAAQQSWAARLLDTYTSAVSAASTEPLHESDKQEGPVSEQSNSSTASNSPYGPYVRTGRGGAGNFTWQSQQPQTTTRGDLEAQTPSTLIERRKAAALVEHLDTGAAVKAQAAQRPASQYVRVGRGYVQSSEIQTSPQSGSFSAQPASPAIMSNRPVAHPGRGGAGNQAAAAETNERVHREKQERERAEAEQRRIRIEEDVQNTLPAPPDAWLGGRRRSLDPPE